MITEKEDPAVSLLADHPPDPEEIMSASALPSSLRVVEAVAAPRWAEDEFMIDDQ